jgi:hypothetical protein
MSSGAIIAAIVGAHFFATPLANEIVTPLLSFGLSIFKEKVIDQQAAPRPTTASGVCQNPIHHAKRQSIRASNSLANYGPSQPR